MKEWLLLVTTAVKRCHVTWKVETASVSLLEKMWFTKPLWHTSDSVTERQKEAAWASKPSTSDRANVWRTAFDGRIFQAVIKHGHQSHWNR